MGIQPTKFTGEVADAIRAELSRRDLDGVALVEPLGLSRNSIYSRLRGKTPFDTEEVEKVAAFLGITVDQLLDLARLARPTVSVAVAS